MKLTTLIVIIVAICAAGFGAILAKDRIELFANSNAHAATIIDCKWSKQRKIARNGFSSGSVYSYAPVAVSEEGFRAIGSLKVTSKSVCEGMIGHTVTILVDKDDPGKARINSFMQLWLYPFILLGAVAFWIASIFKRGTIAVGIFCGFFLFGGAAAAIELKVFQNTSDQPMLRPVDSDKALRVCIVQAMREEKTQTPSALKSLTCEGRSISDLSALRPLTSLEELDLSGNEFTSLAPLERLRGLRVITLDGNKALSSLDGLQGLTQLETLNVHCAGLAEIDAVREIRSLQHLDVSCNKLSDLSAITDLDLLHTLKIDGNPNLTDIRPAANKPLLEVITMYHSPISDISPLFGNDKLRRANIGSAGSVSCHQIEALRSRLAKSAQIIGPKTCSEK